MPADYHSTQHAPRWTLWRSRDQPAHASLALQVGETYKATGRCFSVAAGRISFCYGLKGGCGRCGVGAGFAEGYLQGASTCNMLSVS